MSAFPRFRRSVRFKYQMAKIGLKALASTKHPLLAHIVPVRRCNLACTYCDEYDDHSPAVPTKVMLKRLDKLADLGTSMVSLSGGEPLLHPELDVLIRRIVDRGMFAELLTNAYLLSKSQLQKLNDAGLNRMQISIDNVDPDDVSKKSLKVLDKKLELLAESAKFDVNINSVVGAGIENPEDALIIARRAIELGFTSTVGIIHDSDGQLKPLGDREKAIYQEIKKLNSIPFLALTRFKNQLAEGKPNDWRCRAGALYLYVAEDGIVSRCSQQVGSPGIPLEDYGPDNFAEEYQTAKACTSYCTVSCVHAVAVFDNWRKPQQALDRPRGFQSEAQPGLRVLSEKQ